MSQKDYIHDKKMRNIFSHDKDLRMTSTSKEGLEKTLSTQEYTQYKQYIAENEGITKPAYSRVVNADQILYRNMAVTKDSRDCLDCSYNDACNTCDFSLNTLARTSYSKGTSLFARNAINQYYNMRKKVPAEKEFIVKNGIKIPALDPKKEFCACDTFFTRRREGRGPVLAPESPFQITASTSFSGSELRGEVFVITAKNNSYRDVSYSIILTNIEENDVSYGHPQITYFSDGNARYISMYMTNNTDTWSITVNDAIVTTIVNSGTPLIESKGTRQAARAYALLEIQKKRDEGYKENLSGIMPYRAEMQIAYEILYKDTGSIPGIFKVSVGDEFLAINIVDRYAIEVSDNWYLDEWNIIRITNNTENTVNMTVQILNTAYTLDGLQTKNLSGRSTYVLYYRINSTSSISTTFILNVNNGERTFTKQVSLNPSSSTVTAIASTTNQFTVSSNNALQTTTVQALLGSYAYVGDTQLLTTLSDSGFVVGMQVTIGSGATMEINTITGFGSTILKTPLIYNHSLIEPILGRLIEASIGETIRFTASNRTQSIIPYKLLFNGSIPTDQNVIEGNFLGNLGAESTNNFSYKIVGNTSGTIQFLIDDETVGTEVNVVNAYNLTNDSYNGNNISYYKGLTTTAITFTASNKTFTDAPFTVSLGGTLLGYITGNLTGIIPAKTEEDLNFSYIVQRPDISGDMVFLINGEDFNVSSTVQIKEPFYLTCNRPGDSINHPVAYDGINLIFTVKNNTFENLEYITSLTGEVSINDFAVGSPFSSNVSQVPFNNTSDGKINDYEFLLEKASTGFFDFTVTHPLSGDTESLRVQIVDPFELNFNVANINALESEVSSPFMQDDRITITVKNNTPDVQQYSVLLTGLSSSDISGDSLVGDISPNDPGEINTYVFDIINSCSGNFHFTISAEGIDTNANLTIVEPYTIEQTGTTYNPSYKGDIIRLNVKNNTRDTVYFGTQGTLIEGDLTTNINTNAQYVTSNKTTPISITVNRSCSGDFTFKLTSIETTQPNPGNHLEYTYNIVHPFILTVDPFSNPSYEDDVISFTVQNYTRSDVSFNVESGNGLVPSNFVNSPAFTGTLQNGGIVNDFSFVVADFCSGDFIFTVSSDIVDMSVNVEIVEPFILSNENFKTPSYQGDIISFTVQNNTRDEFNYIISIPGMQISDFGGSSLAGTITTTSTIDLSYIILTSCSGNFAFALSSGGKYDNDISINVPVVEPLVLSNVNFNAPSYKGDTISFDISNNTRQDILYNIDTTKGLSPSNFVSDLPFTGSLTRGINALSFEIDESIAGEFVFTVSSEIFDTSVNVNIVTPFILLTPYTIYQPSYKGDEIAFQIQNNTRDPLDSYTVTLTGSELSPSNLTGDLLSGTQTIVSGVNDFSFVIQESCAGHFEFKIDSGTFGELDLSVNVEIVKPVLFAAVYNQPSYKSDSLTFTITNQTRSSVEYDLSLSSTLDFENHFTGSSVSGDILNTDPETTIRYEVEQTCSGSVDFTVSGESTFFQESIQIVEPYTVNALYSKSYIGDTIQITAANNTRYNVGYTVSTTGTLVILGFNKRSFIDYQNDIIESYEIDQNVSGELTFTINGSDQLPGISPSTTIEVVEPYALTVNRTRSFQNDTMTFTVTNRTREDAVYTVDLIGTGLNASDFNGALSGTVPANTDLSDIEITVVQECSGDFVFNISGDHLKIDVSVNIVEESTNVIYNHDFYYKGETMELVATNNTEIDLSYTITFTGNLSSADFTENGGPIALTGTLPSKEVTDLSYVIPTTCSGDFIFTIADDGVTGELSRSVTIYEPYLYSTTYDGTSQHYQGDSIKVYVTNNTRTKFDYAVTLQGTLDYARDFTGDVSAGEIAATKTEEELTFTILESCEGTFEFAISGDELDISFQVPIVKPHVFTPTFYSTSYKGDTMTFDIVNNTRTEFTYNLALTDLIFGTDISGTDISGTVDNNGAIVSYSVEESKSGTFIFTILGEQTDLSVNITVVEPYTVDLNSNHFNAYQGSTFTILATNNTREDTSFNVSLLGPMTGRQDAFNNDTSFNGTLTKQSSQSYTYKVEQLISGNFVFTVSGDAHTDIDISTGIVIKEPFVLSANYDKSYQYDKSGDEIIITATNNTERTSDITIAYTNGMSSTDFQAIGSYSQGSGLTTPGTIVSNNTKNYEYQVLNSVSGDFIYTISKTFTDGVRGDITVTTQKTITIVEPILLSSDTTTLFKDSYMNFTVQNQTRYDVSFNTTVSTASSSDVSILLNGSDLSGNLLPDDVLDISYILIEGSGDFNIHLGNVGSDISRNEDVKLVSISSLHVRVVENIYGKDVFAFSNSASGPFEQQREMTFGAGIVQLFNLSHSSLNGRSLVFGTELDVSSSVVNDPSIIESVGTPGVPSDNPYILLTLPEGYSDTLYYFDNDISGMGYVPFTQDELPVIFNLKFDTTTANEFIETSRSYDNTYHKDKGIGQVANFASGTPVFNGDVVYEELYTHSRTDYGNFTNVSDNWLRGNSRISIDEQNNYKCAHFTNVANMKINGSNTQYLHEDGVITISFWLFIKSSVNGHGFSTRIIKVMCTENRYTEAASLEVSLNGNGLYFTSHSFNGIGNQLPNIDAWNHYLFIFGNGKRKAYLNNILQYNANHNDLPNLSEKPVDMIFFEDSTTIPDYTHVYMRDVYVINSELTEEEITSLYNGNDITNPDYIVTVSDEVFYIAKDGSNTAQSDINFVPGVYLFDQSHSSNLGERIVFGYTEDNSLNILTKADGVSSSGTPGYTGAYTALTLTSTLSNLRYFSTNTPVMGNGTTEITPSLVEVLPGETLEFTIKNRSGLPILYTINGPITYTDLSLTSIADMSGYIQPGLHSLSFDVLSTPNENVDFIFSNANINVTRTIDFQQPYPISTANENNISYKGDTIYITASNNTGTDVSYNVTSTFSTTYGAGSSSTSGTIAQETYNVDFSFHIVELVAGNFIFTVTPKNTIEYDVYASGGKYYVNTAEKPILYLEIGNTYIFNNSSQGGHPLKFSKTDGTIIYTNTTYSLSQSIITITESTPTPIFYVCAYHANMGNQINIVDNSKASSINITVKEPFVVSRSPSISYKGDTITITVSNNTREDMSYNVSFTGAMVPADVDRELTGNLDASSSDIQLLYNITNDVSGEFIFSISGDYTDISVNVDVVESFLLSRSPALSYKGDSITITASNQTREDASYNVSFTGAIGPNDVSGSSLTGTLVGEYTNIELSYNIINNISGNFIFTISGDHTVTSANVEIIEPFIISSTEPVSYRGDTIIISASNNTREDVSYNVSFTGALTQSDINGSSLTGTLVGGNTDIELSYNVINNISGEFIFTISGETGTDTDLSHAVTVKEPFVVSSAKNVSYISDTIVITATNNTRDDTSYNVILSNGVDKNDFAVGTVFSGNLTANTPDIELSYNVMNNVSGDFVFAISGDYTDISVNVDVISPFVITEVNAPQFLFKGETLEYTVTNQLPTDVSYEVTVQDSGSTEGAIYWSGSDLSGTIVGGNTIDLSFTLSTGAGFFTLVLQNSVVSMSSSTVQAVYVNHNYYVKPVENVYGDTVYALSEGGSSGPFNNQMDLSFNAGKSIRFNTSDLSMNGYNLVVGPTLDVSSTALSSDVAGVISYIGTAGVTGSYILLTLSGGYLGDTLYYFDRDIIGMGYTERPNMDPSVLAYLKFTDSNDINSSGQVANYVTGEAVYEDFVKLQQYNGNDPPYSFEILNSYNHIKISSLDTGLDTGAIKISRQSSSVFSGYSRTFSVWTYFSSDQNIDYTDYTAIVKRDLYTPNSGYFDITYWNYGYHQGASFQFYNALWTTYQAGQEYFDRWINITLTGTGTQYNINVNVYIDGNHFDSYTYGSYETDFELVFGPNARMRDVYVIDKALTASQVVDLCNNIPPAPVTYTVTVTSNKFYLALDGATPQETPQLTFTAGELYIFDQSDPSNHGEQLVFGYSAEDRTNILTSVAGSQNIIVMGTPGQPGAYTQITFDVAPTSTVYYYSMNTLFMGIQLDNTYYMTVQKNVFDADVYAFSMTGDPGTFVNQMDLSFNADAKVGFILSDTSMNGYNVVFGPTVDVSSTAVYDVVTYSANAAGTPNAFALLILPSGYSDTLYYFDRDISGMGFNAYQEYAAYTEYSSNSYNVNSTSSRQMEYYNSYLNKWMTQTIGTTYPSNLAPQLYIYYGEIGDPRQLIITESVPSNWYRGCLVSRISSSHSTQILRARWTLNGTDQAFNVPTGVGAYMIEFPVPINTNSFKMTILSTQGKINERDNSILSYRYIGTDAPTTIPGTIRYDVTVQSNKFYIDLSNGNGPVEAPEITFSPFDENQVYIFDQSDPSNDGEQLVFGYSAEDRTNILTSVDGSQNIIVMGTPGQPGAYTQIIFDVAPTSTVYYYSMNTLFMGIQLDNTYYMTVQKNVFDADVYAFSMTGDPGTFVNQMDLSFNADAKVGFILSDTSMNGYNVVFGPTLDDSSTAVYDVVTYSANAAGTPNAFALLILPSGYSDTLYYFDRDIIGMGFNAYEEYAAYPEYSSTDTLLNDSITRTVRYEQYDSALNWPYYRWIETSDHLDLTKLGGAGNVGEHYEINVREGSGEYTQRNHTWKFNLGQTYRVVGFRFKRGSGPGYFPDDINLNGRFYPKSYTQDYYFSGRDTQHLNLTMTKDNAGFDHKSWNYTIGFLIREEITMPGTIRYDVTVQSNKFYLALDGATQQEAPEITFVENQVYIFDQSDPSNDGEQLVFGYTIDDTTNILTSVAGSQNIIVMGTPGQPGAYTQITFEVAPTYTVYYYSMNTVSMGWN
jgi:hypothetical protein